VDVDEAVTSEWVRTMVTRMTHLMSTGSPERVVTQRRMMGGGDRGLRSWIQRQHVVSWGYFCPAHLVSEATCSRALRLLNDVEVVHPVSAVSVSSRHSSPSTSRETRTIRLMAPRFEVPLPRPSSGNLRTALAVGAIGAQGRHTSTSDYRPGLNAQTSALLGQGFLSAVCSVEGKWLVNGLDGGAEKLPPALPSGGGGMTCLSLSSDYCGVGITAQLVHPRLCCDDVLD
jgi:hypothetical protein